MTTISKNYVSNRVLLGIIIFAGWLFLFFMGMSIKAESLLPLISGSDIDWGKLLIYALTFTPTNTAVLAALAGILGGISSNLSAFNEKTRTDAIELDPESFEYRSIVYMNEHPLVSMFRGFLAFLILVASSYLANFATPMDSTAPTILGMSASSYFKFAVTVSLLAYLVGYDPTQLQRMIRSLNVGGKKSADIEGQVRMTDGKHTAEGVFVGKAVTTNQASTLPEIENGAAMKTLKPGLNGKAKTRKGSTA